MIQTVAITVLFGGAVFYLGRLLFKAFSPAKPGCAGGDCKCETKADFASKR